MSDNCIINIIKYSHRISLMDKDSLLYNTNKSQLEIIKGNYGHHLWLHFVIEILKLCKLETIFYNPTNFHTYRIINRIRDVLQKRFISFWGTVLTSEETISGKVGQNKMRFYRTFNSHFEFEIYLGNVSNTEHRRMMAKLRTSSHTLMCEMGRYYDLPYAARLC